MLSFKHDGRDLMLIFSEMQQKKKSRKLNKPLEKITDILVNSGRPIGAKMKGSIIFQCFRVYSQHF